MHAGVTVTMPLASAFAATCFLFLALLSLLGSLPLAVLGQERDDAHPGLNGRLKIGPLPVGGGDGPACSRDG